MSFQEIHQRLAALPRDADPPGAVLAFTWSELQALVATLRLADLLIVALGVTAAEARAIFDSREALRLFCARVAAALPNSDPGAVDSLPAE